MNIFHKVTWETMKRNKTRTTVTVIGVILSTAMITAVTVFGFSIMNYLIRSTSANNGTWHAEVSKIPYDQLQKVQDSEGILESASIENIGYSKLEEEVNSYKYYYNVTGFTKEAYDLLPVNLITGRLPNDKTEIIIPDHAIGKDSNNMKIGNTIELEVGKRYVDGEEYGQHDPYQGTLENPEVLSNEKTQVYTIVGIYSRQGYRSFESYDAPGFTLITAAEANPANTYQVYFNMEKPKDIYQFSQEKFGGYKVYYNDELLRYMGVADNDSFYNVLFALGCILIVLIMAGSVLLIYNAFSISVSERTKQFGLLSSIGASKKQIRKSIRFEAILVSSIGIPIGIMSGILGIGVTLIFVGKGVEQQLAGSGGLVSLELSVPWISIVLAAGIALITVMISSWIPSRKASKVSVMEALRQNDAIFVKPKEVKTLGLIYQIFHLEGTLASKNFKRNRRKYRTTIVSLAMSMVLFISASSFVMYIKEGTGLALEHPKGDIIYFSSEEESNKVFELLKSESSVDDAFLVKTLYLESTISKERVNQGSEDYVSEFYDGNFLLNIRVGILSDEDFINYAKEQKIEPSPYFDSDHLLGIAYDRIKLYDEESGKYSTTSILLNHDPMEFSLLESSYNEEMDYVEESVDSSLYQKNLKIEVQEFAQKGPVGLDETDGGRVVLIIPEFQYLLYLKQYDNLVTQCQMIFMTEQHETAFNNMNRMLLEQGIGSAESGLYDAAERFESDRNSILALNVLSYGFISLISLIAIANVFNTISTNLLLRRREFAMLTSVGMTRKGLKRMMNYECVLYGIKAVLYGLPLSVIVTFLIYRAVLSGVVLKLVWPWSGMTIAIISVFLVVFATMLYSMNKINKENTIETLKKENL